MSYLDESKLFAYDSKLKEWVSSQESKTITSSIYPWTKTAKAGAVSCYPVGSTELKPTVDFLFSETPPASGDKGPENPSTITGVSEVNLWLAGKNINRVVPYYGFTDGVKVVNDVTFTANADGSVTVNGLADGNANCPLYNSNNTSIYGDPIGVGVWTVSGCPSGSNNTYALQTVISTGYGSSSGYEFGSGSTATITKPGAKIGLIIRIPSGYNAQNLVFKPQIELGNEKTSYEQSVEKQKYTINLGSTYYGGTLDVASGLMTVTHVIRTVDGTNVKFVDGGETTNYYRLYFPIVYSQPAIDRVLDTKCTFIDTAYFGFNTDSEHYYVGTDRVYVFLDKTLPFLSGSGTVVEKANAYATQMVQGGTPWSVTYKLATPYTIQVSPTSISALAQTDPYIPRINTVYSDQVSVQAGYPKSPLATSTELTNAIVSLGGNI